MSIPFVSTSLTEPERDMLAWYRLSPDPDPYPLRQIATITVSREPLAEDAPAEPIQMPRAA